ncbi:MAG TPA: RluA family pseudouridine synthase [Candidatus Binatia bacterium]|nr:RluA family pseudouridine synthase [Candidatus Binatia bacterium]
MTERTVSGDDAAGGGAPRLDAFVATALPHVSRRLCRELIASGAVRVNGRVAAKNGIRLRVGDRVALPDLPLALAPEPELALAVPYEDAAMAAVEKPGGMPAHALDPRERGTAAAFVLARWPETGTVGDRLAPGLVHRLDTGTSGLLLAARTPEAWSALRAAFAAHAVEKRYLAVVRGGRVPWRTERVDVPLAHDPRDRRRMTAAPPGARAWPAETTVEVLAAAEETALVAATIRTGVTHQVRVHLALLGLPVLNDALYGGAPADALPPGRHALHAERLLVPHPADGRRVVLTSALPADLAALARGLR